MCVDLQAPPYAFVQVQGTVELFSDVVAMLPLSTAIGARYMGEDRADEFGRRNAVSGELLVRLTPSRVISGMDVSG